MDLIKPFAKHLFVPLLKWRNRKKDFRYLIEAEQAQYVCPEQLRQARLERLRRLLIHARDNCPFYARRFEQVGFVPEVLGSEEDLRIIPALTKGDILEHRDQMVARNIPREDLIPNQTGGSTGAPLRFFMDRECAYWRKASTIRHDRWAGLELWDKRASLWGNRQDFAPELGSLSLVRDKLATRVVAFDTSEITSERLHELVGSLRREKPSVYVAYAGAAWLLARFIKELGIQDYHRPQSIITSAEVLLGEQRDLIEDVFGCSVFDRYGCREVSVIASECEEHAGMHICSDRLIVEFQCGDRNCQPGEQGEVVLTDLSNFGMPFIRYRIRDVAIPLEGACPCGRTLPRMKMSGGRATDFLISANGSLVSGAAMTIYFVANIPGIKQAQLVQERERHLTVRVRKGPEYSIQTEAAIGEAVEKFFGAEMRYDIDLVEDIPVAPSGKIQFSVCKLDPMERLIRGSAK